MLSFPCRLNAQRQLADAVGAGWRERLRLVVPRQQGLRLMALGAVTTLLSGCDFAALQDDLNQLTTRQSNSLDAPGRRLIAGEYERFWLNYSNDAGLAVAAMTKADETSSAGGATLELTVSANLTHEAIDSGNAPTCSVDDVVDVWLTNREAGRFLMIVVGPQDAEGFALVRFLGMNCEPLRDAIQGVHVATMHDFTYGPVYDSLTVENEFLVWQKSGELQLLTKELALQGIASGVSWLQRRSSWSGPRVLSLEDGYRVERDLNTLVETWRSEQPLTSWYVSNDDASYQMYDAPGLGTVAQPGIGPLGDICPVVTALGSWTGLVPYRNGCDEEGLRVGLMVPAAGSSVALGNVDAIVSVHLSGITGQVLDAWTYRASRQAPWHVYVITVADAAQTSGTLYHALVPLSAVAEPENDALPLAARQHTEVVAEVLAADARRFKSQLYQNVVRGGAIGEHADWVRVDYDEQDTPSLTMLSQGYSGDVHSFAGTSQTLALAALDGTTGRLFSHPDADAVGAVELLTDVAFPVAPGQRLFDDLPLLGDGHAVLMHPSGAVADLYEWSTPGATLAAPSADELVLRAEQVRLGTVQPLLNPLGTLYLRGKPGDATSAEVLSGAASQVPGTLWVYLAGLKQTQKVAEGVTQVERNPSAAGLVYLKPSGDEAGVWIAGSK